jgi:hypothetical protein
MIIEYRTGTSTGSRVLRTYKDVTAVHTDRNVTYLRGTTRVVDNGVEETYLRRYDYQFLIAAINLAPGEYLEVVDVPRD